jgi:3-oxoacyl-[acyl-carrier protein] reductase
MKNKKEIIKDLDLTGKTSIVTGGTSGIGLAIAKSLCTHDCTTAIVARDKTRGEDAEGTINDATKKDLCSFHQCDVGIASQAEATCKNILKKFKKVDILVINAATEFEESINEIKIKNWQRVFDVNVNGAFYFIRYLIDSMLEHKKGNIIIIGSVVSHTGAGGGMHYAASKTALIGIVNRINYELLSKGIRANMISPGVIDTPMLRKKYPDTPEVNSKIIESIPFGRIGLPGDIADLALFLASDMSEYICGQDILVDGGRLLYRRPVKR